MKNDDEVIHKCKVKDINRMCMRLDNCAYVIVRHAFSEKDRDYFPSV